MASRLAFVLDDLPASYRDAVPVAIGTSSVVFRGVHAATSRDVAIKVLTSVRTRDASTLAEVSAQGRVAWHPHVLSLLDAGILRNGEPYLITEWAERTLHDELMGGPVGAERVLEIAWSIGSALAAAHAIGVLHCDVKPSNVFVMADGSVKLGDFGIARIADRTGPTLDDLAGTLRMTAPELFEGAPPTDRCDVYSLGMTLWAAANGGPPLADGDQTPGALVARITGQRIGRPPRLGTGPSAERLAELIAAMTSHRAESRPSAADVVRWSRPTTGSTPPSRPRRHRRRLVLTAAAVAVAAVAALVATEMRPSATAAAPDLCDAYAASVDGRVALFVDVRRELSTSPSAYKALAQLLEQYPADVERLNAKLFEAARATPALREDATLRRGDLANLARADALRSLVGGKPFLFDGESGSYDGASLPGELRAPAKAVSRVYEAAARRCPDVSTQLRTPKSEMVTAIQAQFFNSAFLDDFFADPRSYDLFDDGTVSLLLSVANRFTQPLIQSHWDWFLELLSRRPETRSRVAFERPDLLLQAARDRPGSIPLLATPEWRADLQRGLDRLEAVRAVGIIVVFEPQMKQLQVQLPEMG